LLLAGCATASKAVAPGFHGVWVNADSKVHSWLEIDANHAANFGFTQSNGRCATTIIDIVAKDRVMVPVSFLGSGPMSLRLDGGALVITGNYATQRYVPATRESICLALSGEYLPGAPYARK
jgi:hypothetical protein